MSFLYVEQDSKYAFLIQRDFFPPDPSDWEMEIDGIKYMVSFKYRLFLETVDYNTSNYISYKKWSQRTHLKLQDTDWFALDEEKYYLDRDGCEDFDMSTDYVVGTLCGR